MLEMMLEGKNKPSHEVKVEPALRKKSLNNDGINVASSALIFF